MKLCVPVSSAAALVAVATTVAWCAAADAAFVSKTTWPGAGIETDQAWQDANCPDPQCERRELTGGCVGGEDEIEACQETVAGAPAFVKEWCCPAGYLPGGGASGGSANGVPSAGWDTMCSSGSPDVLQVSRTCPSRRVELGVHFDVRWFGSLERDVENPRVSMALWERNIGTCPDVSAASVLSNAFSCAEFAYGSSEQQSCMEARDACAGSDLFMFSDCRRTYTEVLEDPESEFSALGLDCESLTPVESRAELCGDDKTFGENIHDMCGLTFSSRRRRLRRAADVGDTQSPLHRALWTEEEAANRLWTKNELIPNIPRNLCDIAENACDGTTLKAGADLDLLWDNGNFPVTREESQGKNRFLTNLLDPGVYFLELAVDEGNTRLWCTRLFVCFGDACNTTVSTDYCPLPTEAPTLSPTASPTRSPSASPTEAPTSSPTETPTTSPSRSPSASPTASTVSPTAPHSVRTPSTAPPQGGSLGGSNDDAANGGSALAASAGAAVIAGAVAGTAVAAAAVAGLCYVSMRRRPEGQRLLDTKEALAVAQPAVGHGGQPEYKSGPLVRGAPVLTTDV